MSLLVSLRPICRACKSTSQRKLESWHTGTILEVPRFIYRGHAAHPGPAEVRQARNNDHLGSVGGSRASFRPPGRNVLRTAPRQHATARVRSSGPALAQRAGMRTPCALGSTCAPAVSSFGRRPSAMAATRSDGRLLAGAGQMGECRPAAPSVGGHVWKASFAVEVRSLWGRGHVCTRPG